MKYYFGEDTNEVRIYKNESEYYCTNRDGEGLFYVNVERNTRHQLVGTCDFSVRGLTKDGARKKLRKATGLK